MLKDQQEVVEGLFDFVAQRRELSTSYIKQLYQAFTRHQETTTAVDALGELTFFLSALTFGESNYDGD
jgi:hypothetical protein